jgi:hypothetical protein
MLKKLNDKILLNYILAAVNLNTVYIEFEGLKTSFAREEHN